MTSFTPLASNQGVSTPSATEAKGQIRPTPHNQQFGTSQNHDITEPRNPRRRIR